VGEAWLPAGALEAPGGALLGAGAQVLLDFLSISCALVARLFRCVSSQRRAGRRLQI